MSEPSRRVDDLELGILLGTFLSAVSQSPDLSTSAKLQLPNASCQHRLAHLVLFGTS